MSFFLFSLVTIADAGKILTGQWLRLLNALLALLSAIAVVSAWLEALQ